MRHGRRIHTLLATAAAAWLVLPGVALGAAPPDLLRTTLPGPVAGAPVDLTVSARNATGMIVGFGAGQGGFGLSACTLGSWGPVTAPTRAVTLSAPHTFAGAGAGRAGLEVLSSGCKGLAPSTVQQIGYTVVSPGQPRRPSTYSPAAVLPVGAIGPLLPGLSPVPPSTVTPPTGLTPSTVPVPALPALPGALGGGAQLAAACPATRERFRNTGAGRAKAIAALLCLTNVERVRRGIRPLTLDGRLARAALGHSRDMYRKRFFAHVGPGSLTLLQRLERTRYVPRSGRWLIGENIGFGRGGASSPLALHRAWMHSTPHRANILDGRFRQIGFGVTTPAPFGRGATYTVDFGRRG